MLSKFDKICVFWRAGDANDASIEGWRCVVNIGVGRDM